MHRSKFPLPFGIYQSGRVQGFALVDWEGGPGGNLSKRFPPGGAFASFWRRGQKDVAACYEKNSEAVSYLADIQCPKLHFLG